MKFIYYICTGLLLLTNFITPADQADLILFNGKIITVDAQDNIVQAIAIKGDRIIAAGNDAEIKALAGPQCSLIDLQGKTVTPGLIDSHYHLMYYGAQFWDSYLNIRYPVVKNKADLLKVVGDYAKTINKGDWISANQGFALQKDETISRWDLDAVAPDNPCYLRHSSGQYAVVNSKALEIAGITSATPNPPSSLILKDSNGEPTGILSHYGAENLVARYATGYGDRSDTQKMEDIEYGQMLCLQAGYTSVQDVIIGSMNDVDLYKQFDDQGRFKVRLYAMLLIDTEQEAQTMVSVALPAPSKYFKYGGWKIAMDGGLAARTILMYDRNLYASEISYPYHSQDELNRMVKLLHDTGLQIAVHVSGDQGIDMTLAAYQKAMQENPRPDPRHRIEHGLFPATAALQKFKDDNIIFSTQPQWITWYGDGFLELTDTPTMERLLPLKTMLDMGIHIAFGCDVPASIYQEPKWAFSGSVLRRTATGTLLTQNEKLSMQEALRIHTMGSAYAGFAEKETGSLEPGKYADLVVWSHDLYNLSLPEYINLAAQMTIVGGQIVYDADNPVEVDNYGHQNIPSGFSLQQNYPNPFNPYTNFEFRIPFWGFVSLKIYDVLGNEVANILNEEKQTGDYKVKFDGTNLASGMYFYKLTCGSFSETKKMILLK